MSDTNGRIKWAMVSALIAGIALLVGAGGSWVAAVRTDAGFRQRTEIFMDTNAPVKDDIASLKTAAAVAATERSELRANQAQMIYELRQLTDQMRLIIQRDMREGRIPR